jgi:Bacterial Ig domain
MRGTVIAICLALLALAGCWGDATDAPGSSAADGDVRKQLCGDGICRGGESCASCPQDCGTCAGPDAGSADTTAPSVSIISPTAGATYTTAQSVSIVASASDDVGVVRVDFIEDGSTRASISGAPYSYPWSITSANNGTHSWTARAYDAAGNAATSGAVTVAVSINDTAGSQYPAVTVAFFPPDNVWNTKIATLPVHAMSSTWMATVGTSNKNLHVGFYPDQWGMRYNLVDASTPMVRVAIVDQDPADSDLIPYPFTADTLIQLGTPDSEAFMIDQGQKYLYEMYNAHWNGGSPYASATVRWDLTSNALRADNHSSADEAGLPIFPGLMRWDEVQRGVINHAFRFENGWGHIDGTAGSHLWPARHDGFESPPNSAAPPMGARLRLKASFDLSRFSANARVILQAMKDYGMFLADHGEDWELVGTGDTGWPLALIDELGTVPSSAFEFVDESSLMIDHDSGQARTPP